eukprot:scpid105739/ scgid16148/ 
MADRSSRRACIPPMVHICSTTIPLPQSVQLRHQCCPDAVACERHFSDALVRWQWALLNLIPYRCVRSETCTDKKHWIFCITCMADQLGTAHCMSELHTPSVGVVCSTVCSCHGTFHCCSVATFKSMCDWGFCNAVHENEFFVVFFLPECAGSTIQLKLQVHVHVSPVTAHT